VDKYTISYAVPWSITGIPQRQWSGILAWSAREAVEETLPKMSVDKSRIYVQREGFSGRLTIFELQEAPAVRKAVKVGDAPSVLGHYGTIYAIFRVEEDGGGGYVDSKAPGVSPEDALERCSLAGVGKRYHVYPAYGSGYDARPGNPAGGAVVFDLIEVPQARVLVEVDA
jgi:hypothetical protein